MNYVTVFLRMLQIKNDKFSLKKGARHACLKNGSMIVTLVID